MAEQVPFAPDQSIGTNVHWFDRETLDRVVADHVQKVDTVLDIGSGIRPQSFFRPQLHICCEPYPEYAQILQERFGGSPRVLIFQGTAQEVLRMMPDNTVDSVFLVDLIEHIEKSEGLKLLRECERVARHQIILFTPLGFMAQEYEAGEEDAWGLHGGEWQKHRSGWTPGDFSDSWDIYGSRAYHTINGKGEVFDPPVGAFWAIKNLKPTAASPVKLAVVSDTLPPTPSKQAATLLRLLKDSYTKDYCLLSSANYDDAGDPHGYARDPQNLLPELSGRYYRLPTGFSVSKARRFNVDVQRLANSFPAQVVQRANSILHTVKVEHCGAILGCSGDLIDLPASYLASRWARVPFYAYLFDDYSTQWTRRLHRLFAQRMEPILLRNAAGVIVGDELLSDKYRRRYGVKPTVIPAVSEVGSTKAERSASSVTKDYQSSTKSDPVKMQAKFFALFEPLHSR